MDGGLSLERHGFLGRFDAPVEAEYQRWLILRIRPLATAVAAASVAAWILVPFAVRLAPRPPSDMTVVYVTSWAVNAPILTVFLLIARRRPGPLLIRFGSLMLALLIVDTIAVIGGSMPSVVPITDLAAATFYALLAPVTLLPFRTAVALSLVSMATGVGSALAEPGGFWEQNFVIGFLGLSLTALLISPGAAWAGEQNLRGSFADERIIARQRQLIRRYAPSSVVSRIEHGDTSVDHPQRRKVTVFFSDVVGFTTLADRVDPEALAEIVNDYLGSLSDLIERHGGTLNEFAGDGVMAIFGAPDDIAPVDQVHAAVAAARELQASLPVWSKDWYQHGIVADAQARVGINTGTVSVGTFGSAVRATYTGIGLQTNIAARVQAEAEPGGILLSNTSWHLVKDRIDCAPRGAVMVKGVHFPIELYAPCD